MTGLNSGPTGCVAAQYIGEVPHFISLTDGQLTESVHGDSWTNPISVGPAKPDSVVTYLDFGDRVRSCHEHPPLLDIGHYS